MRIDGGVGGSAVQQDGPDKLSSWLSLTEVSSVVNMSVLINAQKDELRSSLVSSSDSQIL